MKICQQCGEEFKGNNAKEKKFCNMDCYRAFQKSGKYKIEKGRKWFNYCHVCGDFVGRRPAEDRNGNLCDKVFCSRACYLKHHDINVSQVEVACSGCGKVFKVVKQRSKQDQKFCSIACRRKTEVDSKCKVCGVEFTGIQIRRNLKFGAVNIIRVRRNTCSPECLSEFYKKDQSRKDKISVAFTGPKHPNWAGGSHRLANRGCGWVKIAEKVRKRAKSRCECCGIHEDETGRRLDVHHKIRYHQFSDKNKANRLTNLEALCKKCHTTKDWDWRKNNAIQIPINWKLLEKAKEDVANASC